MSDLRRPAVTWTDFLGPFIPLGFGVALLLSTPDAWGVVIGLILLATGLVLLERLRRDAAAAEPTDRESDVSGPSR